MEKGVQAVPVPCGGAGGQASIKERQVKWLCSWQTMIMQGAAREFCTDLGKNEKP